MLGTEILVFEVLGSESVKRTESCPSKIILTTLRSEDCGVLISNNWLLKPIIF